MKITAPPLPWGIRILAPGEQPETGLGVFEVLEALRSPYPTSDATEAWQAAICEHLKIAVNSHAALTARVAELEEALEKAMINFKFAGLHAEAEQARTALEGK